MQLGRHGETVKYRSDARRTAEADAKTLADLNDAHPEQVWTTIKANRATARKPALAELHAFLMSTAPLTDVPVRCAGATGNAATLCDALQIIDSAAKARPPLRDSVETDVATAITEVEGLDRNQVPDGTVTAIVAALEATRDTGPDVAPFKKAVKGARNAINAHCRSAGAVRRPLTPTNMLLLCAAEPIEGVPGSARDLDILAAKSQLALARVGVTMPATQADAESRKKAAEAAAKASDALAAALNNRDRPPLVPAGQVASSGLDELVRATPLGNAQVPIGVGAAAGILALALALAVVRWLETINGEQGAASVQFGDLQGKAKTTTKGDDGKEAKTDWDYGPAFRRYVAGNVAEPRPLPGATDPTGVTDILDAGDPATKLLAKIAKALQGMMAVRPRFTIDANYLERLDIAEDSEARHEVFVRIRAGRTGESVASMAITGSSAVAATRAAGYWAAATVISQDHTVPSWASWSPNAYRALASSEGIVDLEPEERLRLLKDAVGWDPDSGLILMKLANELDLGSRALDSLHLSIRAVICHPHYPVARYRLIASLSMVADLVGAEVARTGGQVIDRLAWASLIDSLDRLRLSGMKWIDPTTGEGCDHRHHHPTYSPIQVGLAQRSSTSPPPNATAWMRPLIQQGCLWSALDRSERTVWLGLVFTSSGRNQRKGMKATIASMKVNLGVRDRRTSRRRRQAAEGSASARRTPTGKSRITTRAASRSP
jgi:hypothetical protein